jgi:hypothetical protein
MQELLRYGAQVEQMSRASPFSQYIALTHLSDLVDSFNQEPVQPPHAMTARAAQLPLPQIWVQSEPIPDPDVIFGDPTLFGPTSEPICFDDLDSRQLAQVRNIPFLFHNDS